MFNRMQKGSRLKIAIFILISVIVSGCIPQNYVASPAGEASPGLESAVLLNDPTPPVVPPKVVINFPVDGTEVTRPIPIEATISSASRTSWELSYRVVGDPIAVILTSEDNTSSGVVSATFDPTSLKGGIYEIRLLATDRYGQSAEATVEVLLTQGMDFVSLIRPRIGPVRGMSLYHFALPYDTRNKSTWDFGIGWELSFRFLDDCGRGACGKQFRIPV